MNLIYWTNFYRGYESLPILAASSGRMTAELSLADDHGWVLMTSLVRAYDSTIDKIPLETFDQ